MYQISFQQIEYFLVTAKTLNFTEASKLLYISQPALSKQIHALESELGFQLFTRSKRDVKLTSEGESLFSDWSFLVKFMENSVQKGRLKGKSSSKNLSVGWIESFDFDEYLESLLVKFSEKYKDIITNLESHSFKVLREGLNSGKFDIVFIPKFELQAYEGVEWQQFEEVNFSIAVSVLNPLSKRETLGIKDLEKEPFVVLSTDDSAYGAERIKETCRLYGFEPEIVKYVPNISSLMLSVRKGEGVTICHNRTSIKNVRVYDFENSFNDLDLVAVWKKDNNSVALEYFQAELNRI